MRLPAEARDIVRGREGEAKKARRDERVKPVDILSLVFLAMKNIGFRICWECYRLASSLRLLLFSPALLRAGEACASREYGIQRMNDRYINPSLEKFFARAASSRASASAAFFACSSSRRDCRANTPGSNTGMLLLQTKRATYEEFINLDFCLRKDNAPPG